MKIFVGATLGSYAVTNGAKTFTITLPFSITLTKDHFFDITKIVAGANVPLYDGDTYKLISSLSTVGVNTTVTMDSSIANFVTGDQLMIILEIPNNAINFTTGVISTAETSPLNDKQESPSTYSSVNITTSFASLIGSEVTSDTFSYVTICLDITFGSATDIWFKFIRKHTTGGNSYEIAKVTAPSGMFTATVDTDGITQHELNTLATRKIAIDLELNNSIPIIDVLWKAAGTTTGTSVIATIIKTWN